MSLFEFSFKVTLQYRLYITPVDGVDLTSKAFEEIRRKSTENCRFRQLHCPLTPLQGTPANIRIDLISPETLESVGYIVVADSTGLSSFNYFRGAWPFKVIQGR